MKSRYRLSDEAIGRSLSQYLRVGGIGVIMLVAGLFGWATAASASERDLVTLVVQVMAGSLIVLGMVLTILAVMLAIMLRKTLVFSPQGLEYYEWPMYAVVRPWGEIRQLKRKVENGRSVAQLLLSRQKANATAGIEGTEEGKASVIITLSDFEAWINGKMEQELKQYAPHLFGG